MVTTKELAIKALMELRGMAREELSGDEIRYVEGLMEKAYGLGWMAGMNQSQVPDAPSCETCSDGPIGG